MLLLKQQLLKDFGWFVCINLHLTVSMFTLNCEDGIGLLSLLQFLCSMDLKVDLKVSHSESVDTVEFR